MQPISSFTNSFGKVFCSVRYDKERNKIVVTWKGVISEENAYEVRNYMLELLKETGCKYMLIDMQELLSTSKPQFVEWVKNVWDEEAAKLGLRYIADVVNKDALSHSYINEMYTSPKEVTASGIRKKMFYNIIDATTWLMHKAETEGR
jgi:hypothetical protein